MKTQAQARKVAKKLRQEFGVLTRVRHEFYDWTRPPQDHWGLSIPKTARAKVAAKPAREIWAIRGIETREDSVYTIETYDWLYKAGLEANAREERAKYERPRIPERRGGGFYGEYHVGMSGPAIKPEGRGGWP